MTNNESIKKILTNQLSFFGALSTSDLDDLNIYFEEAKKLTQETLSSYARIPKQFNLYQTHHLALFLYTFARLLYEKRRCDDLCVKLYLLNRMLNGIDLFYKIKMPKYFLIGHGLGTIFSRATYGNYLVVFQNSTIGVQDGSYPEIGEGVIIYPNSIIVGNTRIGNNCVIAAGTILVHKNIPDNSIVRGCESMRITKNSKNLIDEYFDIPNGLKSRESPL